MFKLDTVVSRACSDQNVGGGHRYTGRPRASCEIKGSIPNCVVDAEFRQQPFEIPEHLLITIAPRAIPQLQANDGAPARLTGIECARHPVSDSRVSIRSKHVDPRRGVDQDHRNSAFAALLQEFLDAQQILAGSRVLGEFGHALAAVEFLDGSDDCFALRLCLRESDGVRKVVIGNIYGGLHDSIIALTVFPVKAAGNTTGRMRTLVPA
jgi:hypothetical protein